MKVLSLVGGWDNRIVPMLDHERRQTYSEGLRRSVKVDQNGVDVPPFDKPDVVGVNTG